LIPSDWSFSLLWGWRLMDDDEQRARSRKERMGAVIEGVMAEAQQQLIKAQQQAKGEQDAESQEQSAANVQASSAAAAISPTADGKRAELVAGEEVKTADSPATTPRGATIVTRSTVMATTVATASTTAPTVQIAATSASRVTVAVTTADSAPAPAAASPATAAAAGASLSASAIDATTVGVDAGSASSSVVAAAAVDWDRVEVGLVAAALRDSALRFMHNTSGTGKPDDLTVLVAKIKRRQV